MPSFSMGKEKKKLSFVQENNVPGIGAYETKNWVKNSRMKTTPNYSMGKSSKSCQNKQLVPGPGSYQIQNISLNKRKNPSYSLGTTKLIYQQRNNTEIPGPIYEAQKTQTTIKYSFSKQKSRQNISNFQTPSPFDYNPEMYRKKSGTSFGKQQRNLSNQRQKYPSPFQYNPVYQVKKTMPQFSFSKQQKFVQEKIYEKVKKSVPGIGSYNYQVDKNIKNSHTFAKQAKLNMLPSCSPAPNAYKTNTQAFYPASQRTVIGKSSRQSLIKNGDNIPGPGNYQQPSVMIYKRREPQFQFPKEQRLNQHKNSSKSPGPGAYNISLIEAKRSALMTSRYEHEDKQQSPGPQYYSPDYKKIIKQLKRPVIGKERKFIEDKKKIPGPGQYDLIRKTQPNGYSFPKQQKKELQESEVGPGKYKLKPLIGMNENPQKQILYV